MTEHHDRERNCIRRSTGVERFGGRPFGGSVVTDQSFDGALSTGMGLVDAGNLQRTHSLFVVWLCQRLGGTDRQRFWLGTTCSRISSPSQLQFRYATNLSKINFSVSRLDFTDCAGTSGAYWSKQRIVFPSALGKKVTAIGLSRVQWLLP